MSAEAGKRKRGANGKQPATGGAAGAPASADAEISEPRSALSLIRAIRAGELSALSLSAESRRACVEHLTGEGYSVAEIAEALKTSERTVHRDRGRMRAANALERGPGFADQMAGQLVRQAETAIGRLRRIARDRECPHASRVEAERSAWSVERDCVELLRRMGMLPSAAHEIRAELSHRHEAVAPPGMEELTAELARLEGVFGCATSGEAPAAPGMEAAAFQLRAVRAVAMRIAPREDSLNGTSALDDAGGAAEPEDHS